MMKHVGLAFVIFSLVQTAALRLSLNAHSSRLPRVSWLRNELALIVPSKNYIKNYLSHKNVPVTGLFSAQDGPSQLSINPSASSSLLVRRVAVSTKTFPYECRLTLATVPFGRKVVSPCDCIGTQKWVQFSAFNRARRVNPADWKHCNTCQGNVSFSFLPTQRSSVVFFLSSLLESKMSLRILFASIGVTVTSLLAPRLVKSVLTSTLFWQQYPSWALLYHLPLVAKLWIFQECARFLFKLYLNFEHRVVEFLADVETRLVEPFLEIDEPD